MLVWKRLAARARELELQGRELELQGPQALNGLQVSAPLTNYVLRLAETYLRIYGAPSGANRPRRLFSHS